MKQLIIFIFFVVPLSAQGPPNKNAVHYTKQVAVPRWPRPNTVTIVYDDLYPGNRGSGGGCYFMDITKPGSHMPIVDDKSDHVTIRAPRGHIIEWHCNWNVAKGNP